MSTIYSFRKNDTEEVRASFSEYKGHPIIDLHVWVTDAVEPFPTKKGLTLRLDALVELKKAVDALIEAVPNFQADS
jgi:hypothetical protein